MNVMDDWKLKVHTVVKLEREPNTLVLYHVLFL